VKQSQEKKKLRLAVGVSGGGRSLVNLLRQESQHNYEVVFVFSSSPGARANEVARSSGLPLLVEDFGLKNHPIAKPRLYEQLRQHEVDLVVLAGFLKLFPVEQAWGGRIINIHPALLPKFGGKGMHGINVHQAVLGAKENWSGATVHFVNERYDEGELISQVTIPVQENDSADALAARVFAAECMLLPWTIDGLASGALPATSVVMMPTVKETLI
jgi:phosphoribosylglycinamide formyltransferase-1